MIMRRLSMLAVLVFVSSPSPCLAQFGGMGAVVFDGHGNQFYFHQLETVGGNRLTGMLLAKALKIKSEELGDLEVKTSSVKAVDFGRDGDTITTTSNAMIKGKIEAEEFAIRTEFGTLTIGRDKLKSIT